MSKIALIVLSLMSFNTFANIDNGLRICNNVFDRTKKQACVREVNMGTYYSNRAVTVIEQFFFFPDKMQGLIAIRDKAYTQQQADMCNSFFAIVDKIQCFRTSGTYDRRPDNRRFRRQILNAIDAIEDGRDRRAVRILERLLDSMR